MCDDCRDMSLDLILDYIGLRLTLQVAIGLARDSVVQRALQDRAGDDALDTALYLGGLVTEEGENLRSLKESHTLAYIQLLQAHRKQREMEAERDAAADL